VCRPPLPSPDPGQGLLWRTLGAPPGPAAPPAPPLQTGCSASGLPPPPSLQLCLERCHSRGRGSSRGILRCTGALPEGPWPHLRRTAVPTTGAPYPVRLVTPPPSLPASCPRDHPAVPLVYPGCDPGGVPRWICAPGVPRRALGSPWGEGVAAAPEGCAPGCTLGCTEGCTQGRPALRPQARQPRGRG